MMHLSVKAPGGVGIENELMEEPEGWLDLMRDDHQA